MGMFRRSKKTNRSTYFVDFLIIIAGIMVSFMLNEWREDKAIKEKKHTLLLEISKDLKKDSLMLAVTIKTYNAMLRSHDSLLLNIDSEIAEDSLHIYLDHVVSYVPFKETKVSYQKIMNDPELVIEKEDSLIEGFMILHNLFYPNIHEWLEIEKDFVLHQLLPYMDENAPFIYPTPNYYSFDGRVFNSLKKEEHFLNMVKSGRLYKFYLSSICTQNFQLLKNFNQRVKNYLEEKKDSE